MTSHTVQTKLNGTAISIETGKVAKQADGAVVVRCGGTMVLSTVVATRSPMEGRDFLPLTVEYREKAYAGGKIPGGFFKREGRPDEKETLTCRLIDRPIRPLFPEGYSHETQVIGMVLSADPTRDPSTLAIVGAGAALAISDIPFQHVLGGVRVGMVDRKLIANPTYEETKNSKVNIVVAGTDEGIVMVESGAQQVSEADVLAAIEFADVNEAIARANATSYGLAAAVWTKDIKKAHDVARRLQAGTVWINTYNIYDTAMPFGGYKQSGFGREMSVHALEHYTQVKSVWVDLSS